MKKSESIAHISTALVAFQDDLPPVPKNSTVNVKTKTGGSYSFAYATLDKILEVARPVLKSHGLAFSQFVDQGGLTTVLVHESGEWMEAWTSFDGIQYHSAQELGSAITYLRRYALTAALGISADEDDDGNVNAGNSYQRAPKGTSGRNGAQSVMGEIFDAAKQLWGEGPHYDELDKLTKGTKVKDLPPKRQADLLAYIKKLMGEVEETEAPF